MPLTQHLIIDQGRWVGVRLELLIVGLTSRFRPMVRAPAEVKVRQI
jgi:hypothetical protein